MNRGQMAMAGVGGVIIGAGAVMLAGVAQAPGDVPGRAAIEQVVHDYILAHPEIIPEAMTKLRDNQTGKQIDANRKAIETPYAGAWAGNPAGDVTLVEFFDYACGYCRVSVKDVDRLIAEDKGLKVVFRELPVLGPQSGVAARASLAAAKQGKFLAFHRTMYAGGALSAEKIAAAEKSVGLDPARSAADAKAADASAEIEANLGLAQSLEVSGTPTFVVGNKVLAGAVGYDALKAAIAEARAGKKG